MSKPTNPFSQPDNWQEIFEQDESYNSLKSSLFKKSFNQSQIKQLDNKPTFNLSQFMSYNFSHFTRFSFAGLAVFTLLAGGLSAQAFAPEQYKPLSFLQQKTLKDFGDVKTETTTKTVDQVAKNVVTADFCKVLKISHFEIPGAGEMGGFQYSWSIADKKDENRISKLNFYSNQFGIQCQNSETLAAFGSDYVPEINKSTLEAEKCTGKNIIGNTIGIYSTCLESYSIEPTSVNDIPFLTQNLKSNIKNDSQIIKRTFTENGKKSSDEVFIFNDNQGNNYYLTNKAGQIFTDKYNLQIDLK